MPQAIRRFRKSEREAWDALWLAYYDESPTKRPSLRLQNKLWADMHDPACPFNAYGIWYRGKPAGLVTTIKNYNPYAIKPLLYISDLYVAPAYRRKKLATKLLEYIFARNDATHCRIEWKTRDDNVVAQRLYKQYAKRTNWIIFERKS